MVVLGAAVWPGGRPSPSLRRRLATGARLWRDGQAPLLIVSGGLGRHGPSEAAVMRDLARKLGVPDGRIVTEDQSRSTFANARNVAGLMRARGLRRALLVTDGYHLPRARATFRAFGVEVRGVAVPRPRGRRREWLYQAAREVPASAWYALRLLAVVLASRR